MGHRLSKIYTRTGDAGTTGLGDGSRIPKDHLRVEVFGEIDELNACVGLLRAEIPESHTAQEFLSLTQHNLFDLGGELCIPGYRLLKEGQIEALEKEIDQINETLPALKEFILPGGNRAAGYAHLARTVCRRAERRLYSLSCQENDIGPLAQPYLNRLSDYLFVLARTLARENGGQEVLWKHQRR